MTRQEIYSTLKKTHPEATNIYLDQFGEWNVDIEDGTILTIRTYKARNDKLEFLCETTGEM